MQLKHGNDTKSIQVLPLLLPTQHLNLLKVKLFTSVNSKSSEDSLLKFNSVSNLSNVVTAEELQEYPLYFKKRTVT